MKNNFGALACVEAIVALANVTFYKTKPTPLFRRDRLSHLVEVSLKASYEIIDTDDILIEL